jgi:hypothetical protein
MWQHQAALALVSYPAFRRGATYRHWKSLCLENYQQSVFFAAHVNTKLKQRYPDRFAALDPEFARKVAEIDRKLAALT